MKKTLSSRRVIFLWLLIVVFSCKKNANFIDGSHSQPVAATDTNFVSLSVAVTAAKQINNSHLVTALINKRNINDANLYSDKVVLDTLAVPDNIHTSYYVFNYMGGGFAIISADKRVEPVLAYDDSGYFPKACNIPTGLVNWLVVNNKNMQIVRNNSALKAPQGVVALWAEMTAINTKNNKSIYVAQPPPPPCQPTYNIYTVGPLLKTQWGQGWPYNALCPIGAYSNNHMPTGCVATAMAQIIYYWKYPATYNYSIMPLDYSYNGNFELARLMVNIGTSVEMDYSVGGSNPDYDVLDPPPSCSDALKNTFQYKSSDEASYDYLKVVANLNASEPFY